MKDLEVITDALRDEGKKWLAMSDSIAAVKTAAEQLHLEPSAFFIGDASVVLHAGSYRDFHTFMVRILNGAVTEFDQIGAALRRIADEYDRADEVISLDLDKIYRA
ncbi:MULTISPECIES: hypothetical protein [Micromonospora]|uniref:Uncharacterized protein n=1 Tax=Micromonospora chalcea TaxID=1874 RepID=A0ABX9Y698_MICCH|nr:MULTISPECIES: hypothetical protein [Micromonospora]ODB75075.1 hypothetical protein A8711_08405 [Micromonospora sp. II]RQW94551.1 hypothetical protein DLJ60_08965 [Micromonospora chalcea]RQX46407.1 hypothetical protein DLJ57_13335 [Micromonospora chalcea]